SRRDWIHWFACDPSEQTRVGIFFERLQDGLANVYVRLNVKQRFLVLPQTLLKDNSEGHVYSAGGIRLECTSPMRGWRLALNLIMQEPEGLGEVHVRFGAQVAMTGHTFELPKQVRASLLARRFLGEGNVEAAKNEILKCCDECQAIMQPHSLYAEIIVEGERQEVLLFGSRLKFFGTSNFLQDLAIYIGYAE
ncbi:uncharacterized protein LOC108863779, partial [Galendromus occidentalis]|uniref:Uncharacterized protein LOC108863779 n=1 Tax=Galendromus occidentalis TaxID=34638 RepID=A0AAJ7P8Z6_9ACAR